MGDGSLSEADGEGRTHLWDGIFTKACEELDGGFFAFFQAEQQVCGGVPKGPSLLGEEGEQDSFALGSLECEEVCQSPSEEECVALFWLEGLLEGAVVFACKGEVEALEFFAGEGVAGTEECREGHEDEQEAPGCVGAVSGELVHGGPLGHRVWCGLAVDTDEAAPAAVEDFVHGVAGEVAGAFAVAGLLAGAGDLAAFEAAFVAGRAGSLAAVAQASVEGLVDVGGAGAYKAGGAVVTGVAACVIGVGWFGACTVDAGDFFATCGDEAVVAIGACGHTGGGQDAFVVDAGAVVSADAEGAVEVISTGVGTDGGIEASLFPACDFGATGGDLALAIGEAGGGA